VFFDIFSYFALIRQVCALQVEGNEKLGGSGGWLLFKDSTGLWQSMSVCFLMLPLFFLQSISVSCL
jgi:hypothetical protein